MHGIAYNPALDEIVVPNPLAAAVLVFRGGANGSEVPIRVIQGPRTKLVFPHSASLDVQNKEILVGDQRARGILVYPWDANGDVAPVRIIRGPKTKLDYVIGVAVDPARNLLVAASISYRSATIQSGLFVFNRTDSGDVAPRAVILGPKTGIVEAPWQIQVNDGKIFVAVSNFRYRVAYELDTPRKGLTELPPSPWKTDTPGFIGIWDITDNGDIPPKAILRGPLSQLVHPAGVALNAKDGEIAVSDSVRNGVFTFLAPELLRKTENQKENKKQR